MDDNIPNENLVELDLEFNFSQTSNRIEKSKTVDILGIAHRGLIPILKGEAGKGNLNTRMRIILIDPDKHAIHCAVNWQGFKNLDDIQNDYKSNIEDLKILTEITNSRYKLIDIMPPYNLFIYNRFDSDAEIIVHIQGFRCSAENGRPIFSVTKQNNRRRFDYFLNKFEDLWDFADEIKSLNHIQTEKKYKFPKNRTNSGNFIQNIHTGVYVAENSSAIIHDSALFGGNSKIHISDQTKEKLLKLTEQISALIDDVECDREDLACEIARINSELNSPIPRKNFLRSAFNAINGITIGVTANGITPQVKEALSMLF